MLTTPSLNTSPGVVDPVDVRRRGIGWRRALLPAFVILVGLVVVLPVAAPLANKLSDVIENDPSAFLPESAESTQSLDWETRFAGNQDIPVLVVYERAGGLTDADRAEIQEAATRLGEVEGIAGNPEPVILGEDGEAAQVVVPLPGDNASFEALPAIVEALRDAAAVEGLTSHMAGPGGQIADFATATAGVDGTLLITAVGVVLVILLLIYRSPVFVPVLISVLLALFIAQATVYLLAEQGWLTVDAQSLSILSVLVLGAGTDYALLLISRFKEELHLRDSWSESMRLALRKAAPPILASGATVILGLLCLLLSDLNSNKSLGPVAAIGIAGAVLAMLVLLPALLMACGRYWFWPFVPRHDDAGPRENGFWRRVSALVGARARLVAVATFALLAVAAVFSTQLDADGFKHEEQFTKKVDSVLGQQILERHFPAGTGVPAHVIGDEADAANLLRVVQRVPGVAAAALTPATEQLVAEAAADPFKVVDDKVQVTAVLDAASDSDRAEDTVLLLREAVDQVSPDVLVGGDAAVRHDIQVSTARDNLVIIPAILVVILLVLVLLLRSLVAPILLVATVVLSFLATLGVCALVFTHVFGFAGVDPAFVLFAFVFLVALGVDYNIFLMSRVREEAQQLGTKAGTLKGLAVTGSVITSAGLVLAATFASLGVLPLVPAVEFGFAVAFGVLLDTLIVRSLLVPALVHELGDRVWWPLRPTDLEPSGGSSRDFGPWG